MSNVAMDMARRALSTRETLPADPAELLSRGNFWSEGDDDVLRSMIESRAHINDISKALGRTRSAVGQRISRLGLRKPIVRMRRDAAAIEASLRRRLADRTVVAANGCHEWTGAKNENGYGRIWATIDGTNRYVRVHRVAWELENKRSVPPGMVVMHTCDNRCCVNPGHLSIGTQRENVCDAVRKGRHSIFQITGWNRRNLRPGEALKLIREEERKRK